MSHLTQMAALTVQNFLSAATGMAVAVALARGFVRRDVQHAGQLLGGPHARHRSTSCCRCRSSSPGLLVSQGVVQTLRRRQRRSQLVEPQTGAPGRRAASRSSPLGPVASQVAIKQLGTNGGGFFNANSAHPFENPTPLSQLPGAARHPAHPGGVLLHLRRPGEVPAARMGARSRRWWRSLVPLLIWSAPSPNSAATRRSTVSGLDQTAGNMEGKEVRFGVCLVGALGHGDHGGVQRLGERDARQLHAAGRAGADVAHAARGGRLRRRRVGTLRHADVRRRRGLHRRADGRPDA